MDSTIKSINIGTYNASIALFWPAAGVNECMQSWRLYSAIVTFRMFLIVSGAPDIAQTNDTFGATEPEWTVFSEMKAWVCCDFREVLPII